MSKLIKDIPPEKLDEVRAARAKYAREYRAKHPEANREAIRRYWLNRAERERQQNA